MELLLLLWIRQRRRSILQAFVADTSCRASYWPSSSGISGAATWPHAVTAALAFDATVRPPFTNAPAVTRD